MNLDAYLQRLEYRGSLEPTLETLSALHRAHLLAVPYENLDIHLGRTLTLDLPQIFGKIVTQRRGGWCFELNGLFAWALGELGFAVTLLGASVSRAGAPPKPQPDHLVVLVALDRPYLADVGFGDGLVEPLPLEPGHYRQDPWAFGLSRTGEHWTFTNHPHGGAPGFVFTLEPRQLSDFAAVCHALQTSSESGFVRATVCQRLTVTALGTGIVTLRGATLRELSAAGQRERVLMGADDFRSVLLERFGLDLPAARELWPRVWAAHEAWLAAQGRS